MGAPYAPQDAGKITSGEASLIGTAIVLILGAGIMIGMSIGTLTDSSPAPEGPAAYCEAAVNLATIRKLDEDEKNVLFRCLNEYPEMMMGGVPPLAGWGG